MSITGGPEHPPIYGRLVKERGDVLAETRELAEQMEHRARQALDLNGFRPLQREDSRGGGGGGAPGSAFG